MSNLKLALDLGYSTRKNTNRFKCVRSLDKSIALAGVDIPLGGDKLERSLVLKLASDANHVTCVQTSKLTHSSFGATEVANARMLGQRLVSVAEVAIHNNSSDTGFV